MTDSHPAGSVGNQLRLYTLSEAVALMTDKPVDEVTRSEIQHLMRRLRAREIPGRRDGRYWKMTYADIQAAIEGMAVPAVAPKKDPAGLSAGSRRHLNRRGVR